MSLAIDFSEVEEPKPVPEGEYVASIVAAEEGTSQSGNPKLTVRWQIEGGDQDGRVLFDLWAFTSKTMWRIKKNLVALGYDEDFAGEIDPEDLVGRTAKIVLTIETSNLIDEATGEPKYPPRNRVKKVSPVSQDELLAMY